VPGVLAAMGVLPLAISGISTAATASAAVTGMTVFYTVGVVAGERVPIANAGSVVPGVVEVSWIVCHRPSKISIHRARLAVSAPARVISNNVVVKSAE
jgi:hypothetical protein